MVRRKPIACNEHGLLREPDNVRFLICTVFERTTLVQARAVVELDVSISPLWGRCRETAALRPSWKTLLPSPMHAKRSAFFQRLMTSLAQLPNRGAASYGNQLEAA
jgi:hypothetical protein